MGTTQQNDDDLIILTDDTKTDSNDEMVINLDSEETSSDDDVILTFDDTDDTPVVDDNKPKQVNSDTNKEITLLEDDPFVIPQEDKTEEAPVVNSEKEKSDDIDLDFGGLDFGDSASEEEKTQEVVPEKTASQEDNTDIIDFGGLDTPKEEVKEEAPVESQEESKEIDMDLGFGDLDSHEDVPDNEEITSPETGEESSNNDETISFGEDEVSQESNTDTTEESVGDMESILNETIAKLEKRQDAISQEEERQELAISHLEEEIKQLESEKKQAEDKKAELQAEDKKIKVNIEQLDKMKTTVEPKISAKTKK